MEQRLDKVVDFVLNHWAITAFLLTTVIQVTPIFKCNPWTALFRWIGRLFSAEVMDEVKGLRDEVKGVKKEVEAQGTAIDRNEMDRIRWEVLDFANSCRNGRMHTKSEFAHVIDLNSKYEALLAKTGDENGVFEADYAYIRRIYDQCLKNNSFIA